MVLSDGGYKITFTFINNMVKYRTKPDYETAMLQKKQLSKLFLAYLVKWEVKIMSIYRIKNTEVIEKLFEGWQETLIWSCLQGCMGSAWADSEINPRSAQIIVADFCFFAGVPEKELILNKPEEYPGDFIIMVGRTPGWEELIEESYRERSRKITRYAIKKEKDVFDVKYLSYIVDNIAAPFQLKMIDKELYEQAMSNPWSKDLCSQFIDYNDYKERGLGVVALEDGMIVSGASSYTVYREGIEIEIDTRKDYRRKGLALACGAQLILACLEKGLYPSWDAHNMGSVALAEKLGYHFDHEYTAYEINEF